MGFEESHAAWVEGHLKKRKGERRGRLECGHGHSDQLFAKNVWYKLKGNFDHLHPEFEVLDWRGRSYFADFGYLLEDYLRLLIEIKDFGTHVREKDRQGHSRECNRETFLTAMGYVVISFFYDDVRERPVLCIMLLRMVLSRYEPHELPVRRTIFAENEVVRLVIQLARAIRPIDVQAHFGVNHRTAVKILQKLVIAGRMRASRTGANGRVLSYELVNGRINVI